MPKLGKCHFKQAKLSPRVQNFSLMTEVTSRLGLCSLELLYQPTLWFAASFPKYALGIRNLACEFLRDGCYARSYLFDLSS